MLWTDVYDIAIALHEKHPNVDPKTIRFTDLWQWTQELPGFSDAPNRSNERILEALQQAWIDEAEG